jgi:DNA-binding CsgD family transcriptional regulator
VPGIPPEKVGTVGREIDVLARIASGFTNAQIARDLYLSPKTVMHHSTSIYRKLDVRVRAEAVATAYRTGLSLTPARDLGGRSTLTSSGRTDPGQHHSPDLQNRRGLRRARD